MVRSIRPPRLRTLSDHQPKNRDRTRLRRQTRFLKFNSWNCESRKRKIFSTAHRSGVTGTSVKVVDLGPAPVAAGASNDITEVRAWPVAEIAKEMAPADVWRPLLDQVAWFEHAKVYVITGEHPEGDMYRFDADGGFDALAKM